MIGRQMEYEIDTEILVVPIRNLWKTLQVLHSHLAFQLHGAFFDSWEL